MRWSLFFIVCVVLLIANACTRLAAAPATPHGTPAAELTTEALVNFQVVSRNGTAIGPVDGVVISTITGESDYVIVFLEDIYNFGKGAIHGPQDHYLAIPWARVRVDAANRQLVVDADNAFVQDAPVFSELPDTSVMGWDANVVAYWHE